MLKAVIFDVDGTLVDSVGLHAAAWHDVFREFGHAVSLETLVGQIGKGGDQLMPVFIDAATVERDGAAISRRRSEILHADYLHRITGFPQVRALFERLLADGKQVALASSAKGDEVEHYKRVVGIEDLPLIQTSADDAEKSKPHPDIFNAALERLGVSAEEAIVVGDTGYDAEAAGRAGMRCIGLTCGGFDEARLREAGCVAIYRDPADLLARFEGSPLS